MTNLNQTELSHIRMAILTRISWIEKWFINAPNLPTVIELYELEVSELKELHKKLNEQI